MVPYKAFDQERFIMAYVPTTAVLADFAFLRPDQRAASGHNDYNELIVYSDFNQLYGRSRGTNIAKQMSAEFEPEAHYKTAYLVRNKVDFGLLRAFNTHREREHSATGIFFDLAAALSFIDQGHLHEPVFNELRNLADAVGDDLWFSL